MSYGVVRNAIVGRRCVSAYYDGGTRHFTPHSLGRDRFDNYAVTIFQYRGYSAHELPAAGQWLCVRLDKMAGAQLNDDPWQQGQDFTRPKNCITQVEVSVQPERAGGAVRTAT